MTTEATTTATTSPEAAAGAQVQPTATTATTPTEQPAQAGKFFDTFKDETLKGYVQNKGFEDPEALANSYMNLEKLVGKEKIPMPKDENDVEGWNKVYDALGRPKSAAEYKLPVPEGDDGAFSKTAGEWFHKAGVSQKQAETIANQWNAYQAEQMKQMETLAQQQSQQEMEALKGEWGAAFEKNLHTAKTYAKEFGLSPEEMNAIESIMGTKRFLQAFSAQGQKLSEAPTIGFDGNKMNSGPMTPAQANARIMELKTDPEWVSKYLSGSHTHRAEMDKLQRFANGSN